MTRFGLATSFALGAVGACGGGAASTTGAGPTDAGIPQESASGDDAGAPPDIVTELVGEMHLHQFPLGSHAWAAFVEPYVGIDAFAGQSITEIDTRATLVEGPCTLFVVPTCAPQCLGANYCWDTNTCKPLPAWTYFDAGEIDVTGSRDVPKMRFWFDAAVGSYASDPPPGSTKLFEGGEQLVLSGGTGDWALHSELPAPPPVVVTSPSFAQPLHLPTSGPLDVRWQSAGTDEVDILVSVSTSDGRAADVRCVTSDTGEMVVPADFVARFPAAPRSTRLEVQRSEQRIVPVAKRGYGVLVHAAFSAWMDGAD
jgi:hypothetical protein